MEHLQTFAQNPAVLMMASLLCDDDTAPEPRLNHMFYQFVNEDKQDVLPLYAAAAQASRDLATAGGATHTLSAANLGLLVAFQDARVGCGDTHADTVVSPAVISACLIRAESEFEALRGDGSVRRYWEAARTHDSVLHAEGESFFVDTLPHTAFL